MLGFEKKLFRVLIVTSVFWGVKAAAQAVTVLGYAQVDYLSSTNPDNNYGFQVRRFNAIFDANPAPRSRLIGDIEFEDGAEHKPAGNTGTIKLSRMFIEYQINRNLKVRLGKMLTPFGLYNELHDFSMAYHTVEVPHFYSSQSISKGLTADRFYSKYSTGVSLIGEIHGGINGRDMVEYNLYTANGRNENSEGADANKSAAMGARVIYKFGFYQRWQAGLSVFNEEVLMGNGGAANSQQHTYGLDLQYDNSSLQFQMEVFQFKYDKMVNVRAEARKVEDAYIHVGYTVGGKYTPYIHFEAAKLDEESSQLLTDNRAGVAIAITPFIYLKTEVNDVHNDPSGSTADYQNYRISTSMAF